MRGSVRLGSIGGIEVNIHISWLIILVLVTWSLGAGLFPQLSPGSNSITYYILGFIAAVLLFVSVLLHELAHSFVAQARGLPVSSITLFVFGGVSNISKEPDQPGVEFFMAVVGPGTSLVLGILFFVIDFILIGGRNPLTFSIARSPLDAIIFYLGYINILLAIFNLIPAFPLDGGRVFRAIVWGATGNLVRSTNIASGVGQVFGWLFIAGGIYLIFIGNFINGLWIAFIGFFINSAAASSRQETTLQEQLKNVQVKQVMTPSTDTISPKMPVSEAVENHFLRYHRRATPVAEDGRISGIVTITDVKNVPQDKWALTPVETIMTKGTLYSVSPEDNLTYAMTLISQHDINQLLVLQEGKLMGLLSRADILSYLQTTQMLGIKKKPQTGVTG